MDLNLADLEPGRAYKLLTNLVVPRPIAWVTSRNAAGVLNLAPFSFFNMVGSSPPIVAIGVGDEPPGSPKHTAQNIAESGQFVVNLVTEELAESMNVTAADLPSNHSELTAAGLHEAASLRIKVPRVAEAKAALECKLHSLQRIGRNSVIIGEILAIHIADELIDEHLHVHSYAPVGRMGSPSYYCRTADRFEISRLTYAQWQAAR